MRRKIKKKERNKEFMQQSSSVMHLFVLELGLQASQNNKISNRSLLRKAHDKNHKNLPVIALTVSLEAYSWMVLLEKRSLTNIAA